MGWYPNADGRDMGPSLDAYITGHWGEDQFKENDWCESCVHRVDGICANEKSPLHGSRVDPEDWCEEVERYDPRDDEPDLDEWRESHDR